MVVCCAAGSNAALKQVRVPRALILRWMMFRVGAHMLHIVGTLGTVSYEQYFKQQERALAVTTVDALFHLILPGVTPRLPPISEAEATSSLPGKSEPEEAMQTAFKGFLEAAVAQNGESSATDAFRSHWL